MSAAYGPGPDVGVTLSHDGTSVYLAHLPDGPLVVLEGVAALIWQEATAAPASGWVGRVATACPPWRGLSSCLRTAIPHPTWRISRPP